HSLSLFLTLCLHDALPISLSGSFPIFLGPQDVGHADVATGRGALSRPSFASRFRFSMTNELLRRLCQLKPFLVCFLHTGQRFLRSEEHTSELQSPYDIVCR